MHQVHDREDPEREGAAPAQALATLVITRTGKKAICVNCRTHPAVYANTEFCSPLCEHEYDLWLRYDALYCGCGGCGR